jgi:hypothetical protein
LREKKNIVYKNHTYVEGSSTVERLFTSWLLMEVLKMITKTSETSHSHPIIDSVSINELKIDLSNYRTLPQSNEVFATQALIAINPDYFWGLMESLVDYGYLPIESIIVLKTEDGTEMTVKEGNRRVAALKLIHGYIKSDDIIIPEHIVKKINDLQPEWMINNEKIPCTVYEYQDASLVDKIVAMIHGLGEKARRLAWLSVARARHNRKSNNNQELALDILEKYLEVGKNLNGQQKERWAGDYPLTVLKEALPKIATRIGASNSSKMVKQFPAIKYREQLENIFLDIGLEKIGFKYVRSATFGDDYGLPMPTSPPPQNANGDQEPSSGGSTGTPPPSSSQGTSSGNSGSHSSNGSSQGGEDTSRANGSAKGGQGTTGNKKKVAARSLKDPKAVIRKLKQLEIRGNNRDKVVTLRNEAMNLDINHTPIAFCLLLRSMFEISAKAYCEDHKSEDLRYNKTDGTDKRLVDLLREITSHITKNNTDKALVKALHGAMTELGKPEGLLSVNSMNQLIHNPTFSTNATDICTVFRNIFYLLEAMNT